jgi:hypothetical protein
MPSEGRGFSVPPNSQTVPRARPASHTVATGGSFPGVKRPEQEVYRPLTSLSAEVRNEWRYTGTATIYLYDMEGDGGLPLHLLQDLPLPVFLSESIVRLKCDGTRAETRFRLSAKRTNPFKSAGASVQSTL